MVCLWINRLWPFLRLSCVSSRTLILLILVSKKLSWFKAECSVFSKSLTWGKHERKWIWITICKKSMFAKKYQKLFYKLQYNLITKRSKSSNDQFIQSCTQKILPSLSKHEKKTKTHIELFTSLLVPIIWIFMSISESKEGSKTKKNHKEFS